MSRLNRSDQISAGNRAVSAGHRNAWLDVLRGMAAVGVVLFHANVVLASAPSAFVATWWRRACLEGHFGVAVFFALSGYCVTATWMRSPTVTEFCSRRARRILPAYWASIALIVAMVLVRKALFGTNDLTPLPRSAGAIVATLFLWTHPASHVPTINWVYWSLTCEVAFYVLAAGLLLLRGSRLRLAGLALVHCVLCALSIAPIPTPGPGFFIPLWPQFGWGAAFAVYNENRRLGAVMLIASAAHLAWVTSAHAPYAAYTAAAALTTLLIWQAQTASFPRFLRPLAFLGEISYSVYLLHVPLAVYGLMHLMPPLPHSAAWYIGGQLLLLAGVILVATASFRWIERPFMTRSSRGRNEPNPRNGIAQPLPASAASRP